MGSHQADSLLQPTWGRTATHIPQLRPPAPLLPHGTARKSKAEPRGVQKAAAKAFLTRGPPNS